MKIDNKQVMKYKTIIALLFLIVSIKAFSQDTLKTNPFIVNDFALIEISRSGSFDKETITIHFDDGKMTDITTKIYGDNTDLPQSQKALKCMKYMKARNYVLVSSTSTTIGAATYHNYSTYNYQYIFERNEK